LLVEASEPAIVLIEDAELHHIPPQRPPAFFGSARTAIEHCPQQVIPRKGMAHAPRAVAHRTLPGSDGDLVLRDPTASKTRAPTEQPTAVVQGV
jgi:hypothetical protein